MQTVTIDLERLEKHFITVTADSVAEVVEHDTGVNTWFALLVDGTHYDLICIKHTYGRPETHTAIAQALNLVRAMISTLHLVRSETEAAAAEWHCEGCGETNTDVRNPERPTHCTYCPECYSTRETTDTSIVILSWQGNEVVSRRIYDLSDAGKRLAEKRVLELAAQGYFPRFGSPSVEAAPERTYVVRYAPGKNKRTVFRRAVQAPTADAACQQVRQSLGNQIVILSAR